MKFNYQARTETGEIRAGTIESSTREGAVLLLQQGGLYVTFLEEQGVSIYSKELRFFERITAKDVVSFSRQLAIMFQSRIPLMESLRILASQTKNKSFKDKIFQMSKEVEGGGSFSKVLAGHPKIFSPFFIAMIKAGEAAGSLSDSLSYLADHVEKEYYLSGKIKGAMIYPALVLVVVLIVMFLVVFFVVPNLTKVFETSGQELPWITVLVINITTFLKDWFFLIIGGLVVSIGGLLRYYRTKSGKEKMDAFFLKIPLIGNAIVMISLSRFADNLATLVRGGLPIVTAMEITGDIIGNSSYKKIIMDAREGIKGGENISSILNTRPDLFPPMFSQMVMVGEKTGSLDSTLKNVAVFYEKEFERAMDNTLAAMEPLLILVLGGVVGGIMFSILLPMYKIISF